MIRSFADELTRRFAHKERVHEFMAFERPALRKLAMLEAATTLDDLRAAPMSGLTKFSEDERIYWSLEITAQVKLCFRWEGGDAHDVSIRNYKSVLH